ncbi:MAG: hypothetical protein ABSE82_01895 [Nitrososphaerales archaeon]|jgi:hypothetical protein
MVERATRRAKAHFSGKLVIELADSLDELEEIRREIGLMNNKTQIQYLMLNRQNLLARVESMTAEVKSKIPNYDPIDLRLFQCIHRVLKGYGRGVSESILWSFESQSGGQPLDLVDHSEEFFTCVEKMLGRRSAKKVESNILFEISNEFGMQLSSDSNTADAIRIARISLKHFAEDEDIRFLEENRPEK